LAPAFTDSNTGGHLSIPYFKVISQSQDLTFKPRFYSSSSFLINTEYRAVTKKTSHIVDSGFKNKESNSERNNNSQSHFFLRSKFNDLKNTLFEESEIELKVEQVSNDLYLKMNDIDSPLIENTSTLNSYINFSGVNDDLYFQGNLEVFEDTTKSDKDKYEYIFPNIKIDKTFNLDNNDYLSLDSAGYMKQFDVNVKETNVTNNLNYKSKQFYNLSGLVSDYSFNLKNINTELKNSKTSKNESELELLTAGMFTVKYPLNKMDKNFKRFLTPRVALRYSPNQSKNDANTDKRIDINNVYSLGRLGISEEGASITVGSDYIINNRRNDIDTFKFGLATVFRDKENKNLPLKSTLGNKQSNLFGNMEFTQSKYFNVKYNFSLDNNLDRSTYDQIIAEISVNNFVNSFQFLEETGHLGNQGYWENKTTLNINGQNSVSLNKRRNTKTNLNEFYNLIYEYKNDCLTAAIEYNKKYYSDGLLKPSNELFFSLTIVPLTKINSTNLKK
jgi:LPS-assembly protein